MKAPKNIKRLIPLSDYVLEQDSLTRKQNISAYEFTMNVTDYTLFLKQPLELSMFVPCDENGDIIPKHWSCLEEGAPKKHIDQYNIYKKSKEKVLFKGFENCKKQRELPYDIDFILFNKENATIEDLVYLNLELY